MVAGDPIAAGLCTPGFVIPLLRCPACRHELRSDGLSLACDHGPCGARFPIVRGVPILLRDGPGVYSPTDYLEQPLTPRDKSRIHELALRVLPSLERNVAAAANRRVLEESLLRDVEGPLVLNLGGKHGAAAAASLRRDPRLRCVEADVALGPSTALVCDPHELPFDDGVFDAVLADAILEHMIDADRVAAEIHRVLKPDGLVYSDVPFLLGVHGGRYDFARFSLLAHRRLFRGFREVSSGVSAGPGAALANAAQGFLLSFGEARAYRFAVKALCRLSLFWLKHFDGLLARRPGGADSALGTFFIGRKTRDDRSPRDIVAGYRGSTPDLYAGHGERAPISG